MAQEVEPLVRGRDVSRTIGAMEILAPVSFTVRAGQALAITGPNGSGKTTLLRILLGRDRRTSGELELAESVRAEVPGIASVTDAAPFYRDLTILEHLQLVQASWGGVTAVGDFTGLVDRLRIRRILPQFAAELSSGERQLAALACALLRPAALIVLDEPEQRLDVDRRAALADLLVERKKAGTGILVATHDAVLRDRVADDVLTLNGEAP